ncbi:MAG: acyl-CoA dehydrogenase family protein [Chloroflexi bacterium]|nr:acyl-CoA dehydrogenase family protein [Chloroflexota bacterium]MCL5110278.1 acyl-CoA dehydrogenase family protein [Chloroflexota bacterium]
MLDFRLDEEQRLLQDMAREFAAKEVAPQARENDERQHFDADLLPKMADLGLLGVCIPERYGGAGMDYVSLGLVCEALEYADSSARTVVSVHVGLNSLTLLIWGTEEQKERFLVPQAQGRKIGCFGLTEPNAGSDVLGMQATARRVGEYYVLNGEKMWISLAPVADHFLVFAYTDREKRARGLSAFVVEKGAPGLSVAEIHGKMGLRGSCAGSVALSDTPVPVANRLGEEGEGFVIAMSALDNGRFGLAAGATGLIAAAHDASVAYAQSRQAFGAPIGQLQLVKEMLAEQVSLLEAARLLWWRAGWMKNQGQPNTRETSLAKWFATEGAVRAADLAIQVHGGYGYSNEYPVERFYRNARATTLYEGTSQIHKLLQADFALGYRAYKSPRCTLPPYGVEEEE